ncbi:MAG: tRNA (adenosine(37)-N6)-threonylcarbamoyltransferase complex transferase subunit TsaD [Chloroflexota bacterium]|nr:tRNA (adenosine(37)-N6)-threonylcarbamoyltransferase complex transferase subunit TsaD [Chloroflexota bacterium]MEC7270824.1 tRNA (adenosine(37)-N6)-threonylcarbamoyltransferase complex transferase subunit TsaD [Chloroflexota bacterium]
MIILGIETSCDETSLSIINEDNHLMSNVIVSQHSTHSQHGGIIPELASRQHIINIEDAFENCIKNASVKLDDISVIGVTNGPGLIGSLIVGVNFAKGLSISTNKPLVGVNHLKAHVFASWIKKDLETNKSFDTPKEFPLMCIIVSGGHTDLVKLDENYNFELIGRTRDDAAGEAFDKAARLLNLGFPGGPEVDKYSSFSDEHFDFPRALLRGSHDFSFSGMKTAFLNLSEKNKPFDEDKISKLCNTFQEAIVDVITEKTIKAAEEYRCRGIVVTGGVAANSHLREEMARKSPLPVFIPEKKLCTDNGAMIASYVVENYKKSNSDFNNIDVKSVLNY